MAQPYPEAVRFLDLPLHPVTSQQVHGYIKKVIRSGQKALVLNYNIHAVNLALETPWMKQLFEKAQLVFCDSDGIRWGLRLLGIQPPPKITYAAWMWELGKFCAAQNFSFYFLGAKPGVAAKAAACMKEKFPALVIKGTHNGYFQKQGAENEEILKEINRLKPDILVTGFGMPLQEKWLKENEPKLDCHIFLNGGAVFDYLSGNLKRAPVWMLRLNLEWLYRLGQDPKRLFKRYVIGNPLFFCRILKEKFK